MCSQISERLLQFCLANLSQIIAHRSTRHATPLCPITSASSTSAEAQTARVSAGSAVDDLSEEVDEAVSVVIECEALTLTPDICS